MLVMYVFCMALMFAYVVFMADKISATRNLHPFLGIFIDERNDDKKIKDTERYYIQ